MPHRSKSNRSKGSSRSEAPLMSHWGETVREKPFTTAAAAAGAAAAGVFLWSKRNQISGQISGQISRLNDQITHWAEDVRSGNSGRELAMTEGPNESSATEASRASAARTSRGGGGRTAKARRTAGRAQPQSTTM